MVWYSFPVLMEIKMHGDVAEVITDSVVISDVQNALDLLMEIRSEVANRVILHKENIAPEFFDLKTRLAGEILQKCVNYDLHLAIVGDFSNITSVSLRAFIIESNRGRQMYFADTVKEAVQKLT